MLRNYLRTALRNIRRNKLYSSINIGGLAIGIAVCMTIMLYVLHEYSYDRFHRQATNIYSVADSAKFGAAKIRFLYTSYSTASLARSTDPAVKGFLRWYQPTQQVSLRETHTANAKFFESHNFLFADSNFFDFFTFPLKRGVPGHVLQRPHTIVITETAAKKYFGSADPIGKTLRFNDTAIFEVTGIAKDLPSNTDIRFDFVASLSSMADMREYKDYLNSARVSSGPFRTWLLLSDPSAAPRVAASLTRLARTGDPNGVVLTSELDPLTENHLYNNTGDTSNLRYLKMFPIVAGLVLLLALINYMSLATARASTRAKEIGVRKVIGAGKKGIAGQFYAESALYAVLSFVTGFLLFLLIRPFFFDLLQLHIDTAFLFDYRIVLTFTGLLALVILGAGSYPALLLSSYNPVSVLYGRATGRGGAGLRRVFTVLQFTISVMLIVCSTVIIRQVDYIRHTDTGIDRENVVMIPIGKNMHHAGALRQEISALPGVRDLAVSLFPMYGWYNVMFIPLEGKKEPVPLNFLNVDDHYIQVLGLQWKLPPPTALALDGTRQIVLNEAAINLLGLSSTRPGQPVNLGGNDPMTLAGVLKDFNYLSLQQKIAPLALMIKKDTAFNTGSLFVKIAAHTNIPTILASIRGIFERYDTSTPFEYQFMDDAFNNLYKAEDRLASILSVFTLLTLIIACLGLFALAAFTAQQRTKEIGIRKVLGASVSGIVTLLSRDFLRLVIVAILIACPLAWWLMNSWLKDFAYRIHIGAWVFLGTGLLTAGVALATIFFQSLIAARANPAHSLRTE